MRVLQLVAADRWTGAAATTLQLAEALREAGEDCQLAFRPGRGLEERLQGLDWCHPILAKERGLGDLLRAVRRVRALTAGCDVVHCHLPHDHLLAKLAVGDRGQGTGDRGQAPTLPGDRGQGTGDREEGTGDRGQETGPGTRTPILVRSVRHPDHLRGNLYHRWLFRGTAGLGLANSSMAELAQRLPVLRELPAQVLPVALEPRFAPEGDHDGARARLGIPAGAVVAGTIGKIDGTRGHDVFICGLAGAPGVWGLIIGKGPGLGGLQALARQLGVADRLVWAGYVEAGLEDLYAAMDLFVFPAAGSDWGHRAIAEASACRLPTLSADLPGVRDLVEPGTTGDLYAAADPAALGRLLSSWGVDLNRRRAAGGRAVAMARARWSPPALVEATRRLYEAARAAAGPGVDRGGRP